MHERRSLQIRFNSVLGAVDIRQRWYLPDAAIVDHPHGVWMARSAGAVQLLVQLARQDLRSQEPQPLEKLRHIRCHVHFVLRVAPDQLPRDQRAPALAPLLLNHGQAGQLIRLLIWLDPAEGHVSPVPPHDDELLRLQPLPVQTQPRHRITDERQVVARGGADFVGRQGCFRSHGLIVSHVRAGDSAPPSRERWNDR